MIDISKYKVAYKDRVYKAVSILNWIFKERDENAQNNKFEKIYELELLIINEDGKMVVVRDEAKYFTFFGIDVCLE